MVVVVLDISEDLEAVDDEVVELDEDPPVL